MSGAARLFPRPLLTSRPAPRLHHVQVGGGEGLRLAVTEWPPATEGDAACCVLVHATGLHARCWDEVVRRLPPGMRCYALDVRGHGRSDKPEPEGGPGAQVYPWPALAADITAVLHHLGVRRALGVAHSMGGYLVLRAALADSSLFAGLLLVDPTVFPESRYAEAVASNFQTALRFGGRRYNAFRSPAEMYERLRGKGSYKVWQEACLADYCAFGLLPAAAVAASSGYAGAAPPDRAESEPPAHLLLACPPHIEAATYAGAERESDLERYASLEMPVVILRAEKHRGGPASPFKGDFSQSPTDPDLWRRFRHATDVHLKDGMSHFIPMQDPGLVAEHVGMLAESCGLRAVGGGAGAASRM